MAHTEETLERQVIYQGRIITVTQDTVRLENGKNAMGRELLEIPAGKLEPGEDPRAAAIRELEEECGLTADCVVDLHPVYPSVGYDTEVIHMYLATGLHETKCHPDEDEFLDRLSYPLDTLVEMVMNGEICDAKTVAGILKAKRMLG